MENFTFYSPTKFAFGKDKETQTGKLVKEFGGSKVLLHFGGGSVVRSGLLDRVKKSLTEEGISFVELGGVKPNPRDTLVYEGIDLCKKENIDFMLITFKDSTSHENTIKRNKVIKVKIWKKKHYLFSDEEFQDFLLFLHYR